MAAEDVTKLRAQAQARQQAEKMETISRLTSGIARDFEQLFTAILAQVHTMAQSLPSDRPDLRRELDALGDVARRGAELVHKLLGFSQREMLIRQPLSLTEYVHEVLGKLRRLFPANIDIQCEATDEAGVVEADAGAVDQILTHLATNARDAMPQGGTLHLEVRRTRLDAEDRPLHAWVEPGSYVSVVVSDTGVGMDAVARARLFEPFFTTKPAAVGKGLGMAMVYGLVKQHKGFVHVYSEVNQGTTVKVYFPVVHAQAIRRPEPADDEVLPGGSESILLVEDDPALRGVAQRLLEKVGYRVVTAVDGGEGLKTYQAHRSELDLVITDMIMPKISGFELYEAIRRDSRAVKVLVTSGFPTANFRKFVGLDTRVAFVSKPWVVSELLEQIRVLLGPSPT